jgi:hypothetical protein
MEKTGNKFIEDFPPATLYLNDLEEIIRLFEENCEEVTLKTNEFENVKPSELPKLIQNLHSNSFDDIYIIGRSPYVTLDLRSFGIKAYVSESNSIQLGLIAQIKDLVQKRKNKYINVIPNLLTGIPMLAGFSAIYLEEWELTAISFGVSFLMFWPAVKYQMSKTLAVYTVPKKQELSFLKRKKDEVIIAISSAFMGALFSFLLIKYLG